MSKRIWTWVLCLCYLMLCATQYANAQASTTGNIAGTVTDPQGAVIPQAKLTIANPATGAKISQTSNSVGAYTFSDLQVGQYVMTTTASGFSTTVIKNVAVETGRTLNVNVSMQLGAANSEVTVSADSQVLETTSNTLAATIKPDAVQDLPISGRDTSSLTQLAPGSNAVGDSRYATFNNLPQGAINITVDGMNSNFQIYRTNTSGNFSPAPVRLGAIEEVSVSTSDLTADSGAEGAVALRFQIKRGTNKFHGSAFWQHSNSALNANSFANNARGTKKTKFHTNDEGGNFGGPIWKNKLFFFGNYEQQFVPGTTQATQYFLTADAQAGNFTYNGTDKQVHTVNVLNVASANGFPSAINPRITSELSQANTYLKNAANIATTPLPYQNSAQWTYHTESKNIYPTVRLDYQITPSFDFHAAYDMYWRTIDGTQIYPGDPSTTTGFQSTYSTLTAGADWTITQHIVNQVQFGLLNDQERFNPKNSFSPYDSVNNIIFNTTNFTNGQAALSPVITTAGLPEPRNNPVRDVFDNLTWNKGKHTLTFGGDYRNSTSHDLAGFNPPAATMGISQTAPDPAISMFNTTNYPGLDVNATNHQDLNNVELLYATLTGRLTGISGQYKRDDATGQYQFMGKLTYREAQTVGGFYGQDSWRPTPHLAINYGFRWQFSGTVHNTNNAYTSPTAANLIGPSTGLFQPGILGGIANPQIDLRPSTYHADFKQPAPNFGFAYNPAWNGGKLVIRGGGAISHYDEGWAVWENVARTNPGLFQAATLTAGPIGTTSSAQFAAGSVFLGDQPKLSVLPTSQIFPLQQADYTFGGSGNFSSIDPNIRSPYIENWYIGAQYKLPANFVIEANYVGNHAVHMWQAYNMNEVNIFENGFLNEFKQAQADLAANGGKSFAPKGTELPIMTRAFGSSTSSNFTNAQYVGYVAQGQVGALANAIASSSTFFCNLVGNGGGTFSPCQRVAGKTAGTGVPINFFVQNPFSISSSSTTPLNANYLSNHASSNYNALQVQLKHPVGNNLTMMLNYAYSHAFSDRYIGNSDQAVFNYTTLRNPYLNHGPAPSDIRNAFKGYAVYTLPWVSHNAFLKEAVNGWTLSPVVTWQSGRNFKLQGGTNTVNGSDSGVVLNGVSNFDVQKHVGKFRNPQSTTVPILLLDPAMLATPSGGGVAPITSANTPGQFGQFVYLTSPQFFNTDFSVTKDFPIWERLKFNVQAVVLNIFNHPNFAVGSNIPAQAISIQSATATAPSLAGTVTGITTGGARAIQFRTQIAF